MRGDWTSTVPGSFAGKQGKSDASAPSTKLIQCEHDAFEVSFGSAPKSLGFFTRLASTSSLFSSFREAPGLAKDGTWPTLGGQVHPGSIHNQFHTEMAFLPRLAMINHLLHLNQVSHTHAGCRCLDQGQPHLE